LIEKARYFLAHEDERRAIAESGYRKVQRYYNIRIFWHTVFSHVLNG
jgi:spore maturation protein CgeB